MGLGYNIRKKVMEHEKAKARQEASLYGISADKSDAYVDKRRQEEYIARQRIEREESERRYREDVKQGGFKGRLKQGLQKSIKAGKNRKKAPRRSSMGLGRVNMGGPGPDFGLANRSAFDISPSKSNKKKGPFDL